MRQAVSVDTLAESLLAGSDRALARGLTHVERGGKFADALLERLYLHTGRAHVVGITGNPGSGKSTLVRAVARAARARDLTVGIVAVDPSSPFSGGAILGDRIRMNDLALERGVFVRSLATRGALGGLSRATADSVDLMDAAGKELIFVETVGIGQAEVDIMEIVHTVVVVSVPGLGDEIQTLKAGILEIADIHVVNKADREGADRVRAGLRSMLSLTAPSQNTWRPPILPCVAVREEGISSLLDSMSEHLGVLKETGEFEGRLKRMVRARVLGLAHDFFGQAAAGREGDFDDLFGRVVRRDMTPRSAGRALLGRLIG